MTRRRFRIIVVFCVLIGTAATVALTVTAFRQNLLYFYTPTQLLSDTITIDRALRLGGLVLHDSVQREPGSLEVRFVITDTVNAVAVVYRGILPDLFHEGQGVVVRGYWKDSVLIADQVLAKHDENYMPPEVYEALKANIRSAEK